MKKQFLLLLLLVSGFGFAQTLNDYKTVIVPLKYDFLKSENQYRMATLSKFNLNKVGFDVFYSNEIIPQEISRCSVLNYDIVKENGFLTTKLYVTFKDCYGKIVYQSEVGLSREKDFQVAYNEALNNAFTSVYGLEYQYNGGAKAAVEEKAEKVEKVEKVETAPQSIPAVVIDPNELLFAQPLAGGNYQLIDSKPSVVIKLYKTSDANSFLAQKGNQQGVLVKKDNQWFFEYYQNDQLVSEKINVKF
ncbi:hypothetical protein SAMN05192550_2349 [Flavobacterium glycines]|uniref:Uncharacterized protein n=1 Tax=Flavobacterium glycines TaxID=551990 RepID=A0A1B9DHJ1_9FLAO|nr:hypothetical protein [Flavobacterium glycines]OCB69143.1 hypothetical protein FBGL_14020 [Flavobacterium glycines]GEL11926.1 hypothetical protein FGL01_26650 [Flavobacterium glycines]SDJ56548.1 hypothetical protein SAMN05192550_2349 [Flavobacterium glycines]